MPAFLVLSCLSVSILAQEKTVINDVKSRDMLLGRHSLSLQWISWRDFGTATVTDRKGIYYLKGKQRQRRGRDYLEIEGVITKINAKNFKFDGKITMRISHINGGEPCVREGEMTFAITGKRKYWRLQEMDNPCDAVTDYVDIYFR